MLSHDQIFMRLKQLPQWQTAMVPQARRWLEAVAALSIDSTASGLSLDQHLRRLGGFGASEIGTLVGERRGDYSPFGTARELIGQKLLFDLPAPADGHLRRGILMEPLIRQEFLRQSGAVPLDWLTRRVAAHSPARHPWMQCTPDDFVALDGRLVLVDYKAPAEPLDEISLNYACQLHQIGLIAEDLGYPVDVRALVAWNHPNGRPEVFPCERDPALEDEIKAAGDHYWTAHVLAGELPPWPERAGLALGLADLSLEAKAELEDSAERWWRLDVLAKEAKRLAEEARDRLAERCRSHRLAEVVDSGPVRIKPRIAWNPEAVEHRLAAGERDRFERPRYDADRLVAQVTALGGDPKTARLPDEPVLDLEGAARWLIAQKGIPETELRVTDYQSSLSRRRADQPVVEPIRQAARGATQAFGASSDRASTDGFSP